MSFGGQSCPRLWTAIHPLLFPFWDLTHSILFPCVLWFFGKLMFLKPESVVILWCLDWNRFPLECFLFATAKHLRTLLAQDHTKNKCLAWDFLNPQDSVNCGPQICTRSSWYLLILKRNAFLLFSPRFKAAGHDTDLSLIHPCNEL